VARAFGAEISSEEYVTSEDEEEKYMQVERRSNPEKEWEQVSWGVRGGGE